MTPLRFKKRLLLAPFLILATTTTACSNTPESQTQSSISTIEEEQSPPTPPDLETVAHGMMQNLPTIDRKITLTSENDPNYIEDGTTNYQSAIVLVQAGFDCEPAEYGTKCGAKIEQFESNEAANVRAGYLSRTLLEQKIGAEYQAIIDGLLLRISGEVDSSTANDYLNSFRKQFDSPVVKYRSTSSESGDTFAPVGYIRTPITMTYSCKPSASEKSYKTYTSLQDIWELGENRWCTDMRIEGDTLSESETSILTSLYETAEDVQAIKHIYEICASTTGNLTMSSISAKTASKNIHVISEFCPGHPGSSEIIQHNQSIIDEDTARKEGYRINDGKHLIGTDMQPGTWVTVKDRVSDCYWEISDSNGDIIDNNFVSIAETLTVEVPDYATGFTSERCGGWELQ